MAQPFYTTVENQKRNDGSYGVLYDHFTDKNQAEAKFFTICAAAGHSSTQIPAGSYLTLGLRGLYSNNPQFTCKSNDATYGYIEIVAS